MRSIGQLPDQNAARAFGDYLYVSGIDNRVEPADQAGWTIWVNDEDKVESAAKMLAEFQANCADPKYESAARTASTLRAEHEKEEEAYRKRLRGRRHVFRPMTAYGFGPLTFALICVSAFVFFKSDFSNSVERVMGLFITDFSLSDTGLVCDPSLPEIRHGQVWRMITPIFIHFGWLHIFFNMLWLRDLGSMIEARQSPVHLAALVLLSAAASNLCQFYFGHLFDLAGWRHYHDLLTPSAMPLFGGMSGVVYALFGYIWLRGKFDPGSGLYLHPSTVTMMLVWLVLCFSNFIPIANTAHVVGLLVGTAWGFLSSLRYRR
jgi:GlpG protein